MFLGKAISFGYLKTNLNSRALPVNLIFAPFRQQGVSRERSTRKKESRTKRSTKHNRATQKSGRSRCASEKAERRHSSGESTFPRLLTPRPDSRQRNVGAGNFFH